MTWRLVYADMRSQLRYCNYWHDGRGYLITWYRITAGPLAGEDIYRAGYIGSFTQLARSSTLRGLFEALGIASQPQLLFT